jgi:hypothetical protein
MSRLPKISITAGETLELMFDSGDEDNSGTVTLTVKESADSAEVILTQSASMIDGVADLTVAAGGTDVDAGEYVYQIAAFYDDGIVEKYPDSNCDDNECVLPEFIVCEALDVGIS